MVENYAVYDVDMSSEIFRDVVGYEGLYEVSNYGRVRRKVDLFSKKSRNREPLYIKPDIDYIRRVGYLRVNLSNNGKSKHFFVHRLVADAFIPNPYNFPFINHKDEDKANSRMDNLEWCTAKYNASYGNRVEKMRFTIATNKNKDKVALWGEN